MKKTLSIILSVAIVIAMFFCVQTSVTTASTTPTTTNPTTYPPTTTTTTTHTTIGRTVPYTLRYDNNGATGGNLSYSPEMNFIGNGFTVRTDVLEKEGYEFVGWNTKPDGTGTSYRGGQPIYLPSGCWSLTLYAEWQPITSTTTTYKTTARTSPYILRFHQNGATGGELPYSDGFPGNGTVYLWHDNEKTLLKSGTLVKEGYQLSGWNTKSDGSGTHYSVGDYFEMPKGYNSWTLYAEWQPITSTTTTKALINKGDINCDGVVNILDIQMGMGALANRSIDKLPEENRKNGDCNNDGKIDIIDIRMIYLMTVVL